MLKRMTTMFSWLRQKAGSSALICLLTLGAVGGGLAGASSASAAGIADLFAAVDVSTTSGLVTALMVSFIGINLLYLGYRYVKKTMNRA